MGFLPYDTAVQDFIWGLGTGGVGNAGVGTAGVGTGRLGTGRLGTGLFGTDCDVAFPDLYASMYSGRSVRQASCGLPRT